MSKKNLDMSEIATRALFASVQSKRAISEHAQEHAPPFRAAVLDKRIEKLISNKSGAKKNALKKILDNIAATKAKTLEDSLKKVKKQKEIKGILDFILKYLPKIREIADFRYDRNIAASSSGYGAPPKESYADYEKMFSYLGKYKTKGSYDEFTPHFFEEQGEETKPAELAVTNKKI